MTHLSEKPLTILSLLPANATGFYVWKPARFLEHLCLSCCSVREFCELAFARVGINLEWRGAGVSECGVCKSTGLTRVMVDPRYFRPTEVSKDSATCWCLFPESISPLQVDILCGNPAKAQRELG